MKSLLQTSVGSIWRDNSTLYIRICDDLGLVYKSNEDWQKEKSISWYGLVLNEATEKHRVTQKRKLVELKSSLAKPQSPAAQRAEQRYWMADRKQDEVHLVGLWVVSSKFLDSKFLKVHTYSCSLGALLAADNISLKK